ncbi:hypothetical protein ACLOJK_003426 [Asimina triloba]
MNFSGNNSCYNQQDLCRGLDDAKIKPPKLEYSQGFYPRLDANQPCKLEYSQGFLDPHAPVEYDYVIYPNSMLEPPKQPLLTDLPKNPSISEIQEDCSDGCEDTIINNPIPNVGNSISCSSSTSDHHQPNEQTKQKRRRRPSVRFVDLITKKKLSLGDRVHYRKKNKKELGAGIVSHTGIECCCCGNIYSMSKFEDHVVFKFNGKATHRAPTHIYLDNGISLENLQLKILQEDGH